MELVKKRKVSGIAIKPKHIAIAGKVIAVEDLSGVTAKTIQSRLKKLDVSVSIKRAEQIHESINGKPKAESETK